MSHTTVTCPSCGETLIETAKFCGSCGLPMPESGWKPQVFSLTETAIRTQKLFLGREEQLQLVPPIVEKVLNHQGQMIVVEGPIGIGKTAFTQQLPPFLNDNGFQVFRLHGMPEFNNLSYHLFHQLVVQITGITPTTPRHMVAAMISNLRSLGLSAVDTHYLSHLFPIDIPQTTDQRLDDRVRLMGLSTAITHLIRRLAKKAPLALILDHLHLTDSLSFGYLKTLEEIIQNERVLIITTSREANSVLSPNPHVHMLPLPPLNMKHLLQLARQHFETERLPIELEENLQTQSNGNPLVLFVLLDYLRDKDYLILLHGSWRVSEKLRGMAIPSELSELMAERFKLIKPHIQDLLRLIACLASESCVTALKNLYSYANYLMEDLDELIKAHFIRTRILGEQQFINFSHNYLQEWVYRQTSAAGLQVFHPKIAEYLQKSQTLNQPMKNWLIVHHIVFQNEKAAHLMQTLDMVGNTLMRQLHFRMAALCFQRESQIARYLTANPENSTDIQRKKMLHVLFKLGRCYRAMRDAKRAQKTYRLILEMANDLQMTYLTIDTLLELSDLLMNRGQKIEATNCLQEAIDKARLHGDPYTISRALGKHGELLRLQQVFEKAEDLLVEALEMTDHVEPEVEPTRHWSAEIRLSLGQLKLDRNELSQSLPLLIEAMESSMKSRNVKCMIRSMERLGALYGQRQEYDRAIGFINLGLNVARTVGDRQSMATLSMQGGRLYALKKDQEHSRLMLLDSIRFCQEINWPEGIEHSRRVLHYVEEETHEPG